MSVAEAYRATNETLLPYALEEIIRRSRIDRFHGDIVIKFRDGEIWSARIEKTLMFSKP